MGRAGLGGRGGAGFPTATKMTAVRSVSGTRRRRPAVVANGCEGEPASAKDRTLLRHSPHLVIDGMVAAAAAIKADRAVLCIKEGSNALESSLRRALDERHGESVRLELVTVPARYVAGQESALVNWVNGGRPVPSLQPPRPSERGVDRRPTLVDNVETLANLALIARFGAPWWQRLGTADDPGTCLVTVSGGVERPGVHEVALGTRLNDVLQVAGARSPAGVLVGGYFGTWLSNAQAAVAHLSAASLGSMGATLGCGVVAVLPEATCPPVEVAGVARWLASQSAGQCGPCANGLPALASGWEHLVTGDDIDQTGGNIIRWSGMVRGRGACRLPDAAAAFASSAIEVFADHIESHRLHGPCPETGAPVLLPVTWFPVSDPVPPSPRDSNRAYQGPS